MVLSNPKDKSRHIAETSLLTGDLLQHLDILFEKAYAEVFTNSQFRPPGSLLSQKGLCPVVQLPSDIEAHEW